MVLMIVAGVLFVPTLCIKADELFIAKVTISKAEAKSLTDPILSDDSKPINNEESLTGNNQGLVPVTESKIQPIDKTLRGSPIGSTPIESTPIKSTPILSTPIDAPAIGNIAKNPKNRWYQLQGNINSDYVYLMLEDAGQSQVTGYLFDNKGNNKNIYGEWYKGQLQIYSNADKNNNDDTKKGKRLNIIINNR